MIFIKCIDIFTPDSFLENRDLLIQGGIIFSMEPSGTAAPPDRARVMEGKDLILVPGFMDLQLNGGFGHDFAFAPETIWTVAEQLPRFGVTSFLPTIITSQPATLAQAQEVMTQGRPKGFRGGRPLGLHLEGPFLNPGKKGAHNPRYLTRPDPGMAKEWSAETGVALVTLAPELPGALDLIEDLRNRGVVVSAGHSLATFDQARAGIEAGITYGTHIFNAMPQIRHRDPGLACALLTDSRCVAGLILDHVHLHPAVSALIWQAKGRAGTSLVTDAMAALGMPPGQYKLKDFKVMVTQQDARLETGELAGSILCLDQALRNLVDLTCAPLEQALATITTTPARLLGIPDTTGRIAPGMTADLVMMTRELEVVATLCSGQITFEKEKTK